MKFWKKRSFSISIFILLLISTTSFAFVPDATNSSYFAGDGHVHTILSPDTLFIGDSIEEMALSGKNQGLSWEIITDHSDVVLFNLIGPYIMTSSEWQNQVSECQTVSQKLGITVLPGEEITIGNGNIIKAILPIK